MVTARFAGESTPALLTDEYEKCLDYGHEWEERIGLFGQADVFAWQECKWCGEEREYG